MPEVAEAPESVDTQADPIVKIFIGYTTKLVPDMPEPTFTAPGNYKDEAKIKANIEDQQTKYREMAALQPYTGALDTVAIVDPVNEKTGFWRDQPDGDKGPLCVRVASWLTKTYPDAWEHTTNPRGKRPKAIFIGFNPRLFLKMLGLECSLPENQPQSEGRRDTRTAVYAPLGLWFANGDHRDIQEAVMPREFSLSWDIVLKRRQLVEFAAKHKWDGPGKDADADSKMAAVLAGQLGMLSESD